MFFDALSGSAKFRAALALRIAFSKVLTELYDTPLDLFILDEGLGSLDKSNLPLIKQSLRDVATAFKLFLMITHIEELEDTFPTEIRLQRQAPYLQISSHIQET